MATKSNGIFVSMPYWDRRFREVAKEYPEIETREHHIDILSARLVMAPEQFRVIVATNLFGDILTRPGPGRDGHDRGGTLGQHQPGAEISRACSSRCTAARPTSRGRAIANPVGQIWSGAMLLEHLGEPEAAALIVRAIERVLGDPAAPKTRDLGGRASTGELGRAIAEAVAAGRLRQPDRRPQALHGPLFLEGPERR